MHFIHLKKEEEKVMSNCKKNLLSLKIENVLETKKVAELEIRIILSFFWVTWVDDIV